MVNWLIGHGESLVQQIDLSTGGGEKAYPYAFEETLERLQDQLDETAAVVEALPSLACPNDEAVIALTLHPSFLAKTYHPANLLSAFGLRQVGSRERRLTPQSVTSKRKEGEELVSSELFVAGPRSRIADFARRAKTLREQRILAQEFRRIESVRALGRERIKRIRSVKDEQPLEVVLHADTNREWGKVVLSSFVSWCETLGVRVDLSNRQQVGGLAFIGLRATVRELPSLVTFAFTRLVRRMPKIALRDVKFRATSLGLRANLPKLNLTPVLDEFSVAIFDGGIPADHPFGQLVRRKKVSGLGAATADGYHHGMQVTSAILYGPIGDNISDIKPYSKVDHWRVIDNQGDDFELLTTLDRICEVISQHRYKIINISLGPDDAILDDDVHVWTARLDQLAADGQTLIVCAAGNNGKLDEASGLIPTPVDHFIFETPGHQWNAVWALARSGLSAMARH